ncbi:hypothetical protein SKAU_G00417100 [Synaphobranchus kaupii]|uniref:Uncharacterized protein n=1 Tax=Synaphobranchus kaupii TaxID=118154 RepID=A0A9Q1E5W4_SYNKA|nr:hypothetical protein SKAU_G00417100 [Synaphobranchus kaupii]
MRTFLPQAALLVLYLPVICVTPPGFTIKCKYGETTTCEDHKCSWDGFKSSAKELQDIRKFKCVQYKDQFSCMEEDDINATPFCETNEECGFSSFTGTIQSTPAPRYGTTAPRQARVATPTSDSKQNG